MKSLDKNHLTVVYRLSGQENGIARPTWYSKQLCLLSFLEALKSSGCNNISLCLLLDNQADKNAFLVNVVGEAINAGFITKKVDVSGNCSSYLEALNLGLNKSNGRDVILMAEDDYLWLPESLDLMLEAFAMIPEADYVTPYDHPVRYDPNFSGGSDLPHWCSRIYCTNGRHFRSQESTCMTFMVRARILNEDKPVHWKYVDTTKKCPNDRELFRSLQHLGDKKHCRGNRRLLLGPVPSLATHVHLPYLAPVVNWEQVAYNLI